MFISFIIPVYNAEKYLRQCLESCYNQDLDTDDFELVCINDGSEDASLAILKEFAEGRPNMVILDQTNSGVSVSRNRGISQAKGDYIWFVDADDQIKPNCLKMLKDAVMPYDLFSFYGYTFLENLTTEEQTRLEYNQLVGNMTYWGFVALHIYRREIISENQIRFDTEIAYGEDELFYVDAQARANKIKTVEWVLYLYRTHQQSAMNQLWNEKSRMKRLDSVVRCMIVLKDGLDNNLYTKPEAVCLLRARYDLAPFLFAPLDRKTTDIYKKKLREHGLLDAHFLEKYNLPSEKNFTSVYMKERYFDKTVAFVKSLLPQKLVNYIRFRLRSTD